MYSFTFFIGCEILRNTTPNLVLKDEDRKHLGNRINLLYNSFLCFFLINLHNNRIPRYKQCLIVVNNLTHKKYSIIIT